MDEHNFQRIRNIISKCPKKQQTWSQLTMKHFPNQDVSNQAYDPIWAGKLGMLVKDFLEVRYKIIRHILLIINNVKWITFQKLIMNYKILYLTAYFWRRGCRNAR